jgi:hypothetical protein
LRFAGLRAAVFLLAVDFFAVDLRLDVDLFLAAPLLAAAMLPPSVVADPGFRSGPYDAMRFKRRRSRSLIPPHTP